MVPWSWMSARARPVFPVGRYTSSIHSDQWVRVMLGRVGINNSFPSAIREQESDRPVAPQGRQKGTRKEGDIAVKGKGERNANSLFKHLWSTYYEVFFWKTPRQVKQKWRKLAIKESQGKEVFWEESGDYVEGQWEDEADKNQSGHWLMAT